VLQLGDRRAASVEDRCQQPRQVGTLELDAVPLAEDDGRRPKPEPRWSKPASRSGCTLPTMAFAAGVERPNCSTAPIANRPPRRMFPRAKVRTMLGGYRSKRVAV
jgi:hypothetical protein